MIDDREKGVQIHTMPPVLTCPDHLVVSTYLPVHWQTDDLVFDVQTTSHLLHTDRLDVPGTGVRGGDLGPRVRDRMSGQRSL